MENDESFSQFDQDPNLEAFNRDTPPIAVQQRLAELRNHGFTVHSLSPDKHIAKIVTRDGGIEKTVNIFTTGNLVIELFESEKRNLRKGTYFASHRLAIAEMQNGRLTERSPQITLHRREKRSGLRIGWTRSLSAGTPTREDLLQGVYRGNGSLIYGCISADASQNFSTPNRFGFKVEPNEDKATVTILDMFREDTPSPSFLQWKGSSSYYEQRVRLHLQKNINGLTMEISPYRYPQRITGIGRLPLKMNTRQFDALVLNGGEHDIKEFYDKVNLSVHYPTQNVHVGRPAR